MKRFIRSRRNKPTLINLDYTVETRKVPRCPKQAMFGLVLGQYFSEGAEEMYLTPRERLEVEVAKKGLNEQLPSVPLSFQEGFLRGLTEWKLMDYNSYQDKEQWGIIEARFMGRNYQLEIAVMPSQNGREIVFRPSRDMVEYERRIDEDLRRVLEEGP